MIRAYTEGDHVAIAEIFSRAVHEIASEYYTKEQCRAWSEENPNPEHWKQRCSKKKPYVFVQEHQVLGFLELEEDGHIDCMYVHPNAKRKGIASALVEYAVKTAFEKGENRIFVEASICAKPVFEQKGFRIVREKEVTIKCEKLKNYDMELTSVNPDIRNEN